jgi:hypothetical protein
LKTRFARPREFYDNLKGRNFRKMRTVGAHDRGRVVAFARRANRSSGPAVNVSFTMQQIVHHSEQMAAPAGANPRAPRAKSAAVGMP